MRLRVSGLLAGVLVVLAAQTASACHGCRKTPCVYAAAPAPAVQCVTEMVPYTVMKPRMRVDFHPVTETIMVRQPETTFVERQRVVCKPVYDTTYIQRRVVVCKPVFETSVVNQTVTVCRPVSTTRQVTDICMQPVTQLVNVPVRQGHCGRCGKAAPVCGCQNVAQTSFTPVPVVRNVVETHMVRETQTRQVPVTRCTLVREEKIENVPITHCRIEREVVTERVPITRIVCVPKTITRQVPVPVCETVAVTCYRPVTRMVALAPAMGPAPQPYPAPQGVAPSNQAGPSGQSNGG